MESLRETDPLQIAFQELEFLDQNISEHGNSFGDSVQIPDIFSYSKEKLGKKLFCNLGAFILLKVG